MLFSRPLVFVSLLTTAPAQFNLSTAVSELPACAISCSQQELLVARCAFEDIPNCLCTNVTLQAQISGCVLTACNQTEQFIATTITQATLCKGVPQPSRSAEIIRVVIVISAVTFPIFILRLFSRYIVSGFWWDDWAIIASGTLVIPLAVIPVYSATRGFGKHAWDVPPQNISSLAKLYYVSQILYLLVLHMTKASILLLFLRIFPDRHFRLVTKICLGWLVSLTAAFTIAIALQCVPASVIWDTNVKGRCINSMVLIYAAAAFSIFEDIVIILLPVRELRNLNLRSGKKFSVIFVFVFGSFACVTSIVRLTYINDYSFQSLDTTWSGTDVLIWSFLEIYTAMICGCLMTIRPLLTLLFQSTRNGTEINFRSHITDSKSAGAHWNRVHSSVIELQSTGSTKMSTDAERVHHEMYGQIGGLEIWVA